MAYADKTSLTDRGAGIAGVIVVHAAMGALVLTGLTVTGMVAPEDERLVSLPFLDPPPPPPEPKPAPQSREQAAPRKIVTPVPPIIIDTPSFVETITELPELSDTVVLTIPPPSGDTRIETPAPAAFDPVAATPRGDPARWVTDNDYKNRWVREGLSGTARFRLDIGADGRVRECTITRSTGHAQLDAATCALIERRARFEPARNSAGEPVAGRFASEIEWRLP